MSAHSLEYLCAGLCDIAQAAAPQLRDHGDGVVAFNVIWRGVGVDIMFKPSASQDHAFVLIELGLPDPARANPSLVLFTLMNMNFLALRVNQPVFSCHPETCAAVLQWPLSLADATPAGLHRMIEEGVVLALQWRETYFLPQHSPAKDSAAPAPPHGLYA